jgi:hypothetical protein
MDNLTVTSQPIPDPQLDAYFETIYQMRLLWGMGLSEAKLYTDVIRLTQRMSKDPKQYLNLDERNTLWQFCKICGVLSHLGIEDKV